MHLSQVNNHPPTFPASNFQWSSGALAVVEIGQEYDRTVRILAYLIEEKHFSFTVDHSTLAAVSRFPMWSALAPLSVLLP